MAFDDDFDASDAYCLGWAFFKCCGESPPPAVDSDLAEWIKGFCAALADYGQGEYPTIQVVPLALNADTWPARCVVTAGGEDPAEAPRRNQARRPTPGVGLEPSRRAPKKFFRAALCAEKVFWVP